jgi:hypothetical protein
MIVNNMFNNIIHGEYRMIVKLIIYTKNPVRDLFLSLTLIQNCTFYSFQISNLIICFIFIVSFRIVRASSAAQGKRFSIFYGTFEVIGITAT